MIASALILLSPGDNVAVCRRHVAAGEHLADGSSDLVARDAVPLGHKIALLPIPVGATVLKHGMAIGSATVDIEPGEWVHLHNMRSNYISTHTRASKVRL